MAAKLAGAGLATLMVGLVLIAVSLVWQQADSGEAAWSEADSQAYYEASKRYHALSSQRASAELDREQAAAKAEYERLRGALESARGRGARVGSRLRWSGIALVAIGLIGYLALRRSP